MITSNQSHLQWTVFTRRVALSFTLLTLFTIPATVLAQDTIATAEPGPATTFSTSAPLTFTSSFDSADQTSSPSSTSTGFSGFIDRYQARVTATQAEQPHWITPLVLVTPRLEQELRTDFVRQVGTNRYTTWSLGNSKGLELIPWKKVEILLNVPPFIDHTAPKSKDGFGDLSFNSKYRILSRNEEHGDYILTAFFAATVPTGKNGNGSCCAVVTPSLAGGKGWGNFDVETTIGGSLPVSNSKGLGHTITWNTVLQYRLDKTGPARFIWPEVEFNSSYFKGGANDGKYTTYGTYGMVIGRLPLRKDAHGNPGRLGLTFGVGEQVALNSFYTTNHNLVFTARLPF
jgi:hypothetical protein